MRVLIAFALAVGIARAEVSLLRTPNEGIQPQAVVDQSGTIHLVYFKGDPRAGDLFYVNKGAKDGDFLKPLPVNSKSGTAIAVGTIRGAQVALGKNGRLHVAWNSADGKAMFYARLNDARNAFDPERNVMTWTGGLDSGGSVAADDRGNVHVSWHGSAPDNKERESGRAVFVAKSRDEGKTFAKEVQANPTQTGACGCCGMKALAADDHVYLLYRAATKMTARDMTLLVSDGGAFKERVVSKWTLGTCPMSSADLLKTPAGVLAAWEMENGIGFSAADALGVATPSGTGKRKHPSLAQNASATVLLAWAENSGWEKGGSLAWQLFKDKKAGGEVQRGGALPVWSMPAAIAVGEQFHIIY